MRNTLCTTLLCGLISFPASASDSFNFQVATGFPFVSSVEASVPLQERNGRAYLNARLSIDAGAALGYEYALDPQQQHALGAVIGSIGIRGKDCNQEDGFEQVGCALTSLFRSRVDGVGVTYSFNNSGLNQRGFRARIEAGRGEHRSSGTQQWVANLVIGYQF